MKQFFLNSKLLFKASYFNAIIVGVKIVTGIIVSKVLAYFLGPNGFALLGNLKNFTQIATGFTAEGYQNATIRYVAEYKDENQKLKKTYATVFQTSVIISLLLSVIILVFSNSFSQILFKTYEYNYILKVLAFGLPFLSLNLIIIYILNGLEEYKKLTVFNSVLSIVNLLVTVVLVVNYNLVGAMLSVAIGPVIVFGLNLMLLGEKKEFLLSIFKPKLFSWDILKNMNVYLIMATYSTVIVAITYLLIRNMIIDKFSTEEAGYWEAMNRISVFYLMFFISLTSFYLLPRLSKVNEFQLFKQELKGFYKLVIPLLLVAFILIYFLRFFILKLFLSNEFLPVESLFLWQLIGDFISVLAIALVKQFHAKLMVKAYFFCNGILYLMYYTFSYFLIDSYGLVGVVKAYTLSYFIYFILVILFVSYYFKTNINAKV